MTLLVGFVVLHDEIMSEQVSGCVTLVLHAGAHQWCKEQNNDEQFSTQKHLCNSCVFLYKDVPCWFQIKCIFFLFVSYLFDLLSVCQY